MRGISWIEFLITFSIFLAIFIIFLLKLYNIQTKLISDREYIERVQEFFISSYYYIETRNYSSIKSFFDFFNKNFVDLSFPVLLVLNDSITNCFNCITLYYNYSDSSINFLQNVSYNYQTLINVFLISLGNMSFILNNSNMTCYNYLPIENYVVKECSLNLTGNSTAKVYPVKNIVYISTISSFVNLSLYNNTIQLSKITSPLVATGGSFTFYIDYPSMVVRKVLIIS